MADEVLELVEGLVSDFGEFKKKSLTEQGKILKEAQEIVTSANAEQKAEAEKWWKELNGKVDEINKDVAAKGATVKQLQEELEEYKAKGGRMIVSANGQIAESTLSLIAKEFEANFDQIKAKGNLPTTSHDMRLKAVGNMTAADNLTGSVQATYASQPALRGRRKLHIRDLLNVVTSATGLWKFYRQNLVAGEGSFQTQSTHGALKSQLDYDFTEVTVSVNYLAGFIRIAKQMLQDLPFMQSFVSNELLEDYLRAEDNKFFGELYSAATGLSGSFTSSAVTVEKIIDAIAALEENDHDVNGIVTTPSIWAKILKTKPSDYSIPGGVSISPNGDVMIVGVPVLKTTASNIGSDRVLLGDWSKAALIQTEGLSVRIYEQDSDNVQRNLVTVKAEARVALATLRPDAFGWFGGGTT